jgi:hypothetical protein
MPTAAPTRARTQAPQDFSLVAYVRSSLQDCDLKKGEGDAEMAAVAEANRREAKHSNRVMRGPVLPLQERAESGGLTSGSFADGGALVSGGLSLAAALQPVLQLERLGARRVSLQWRSAGDRTRRCWWWLGY